MSKTTTHQPRWGWYVIIVIVINVVGRWMQRGGNLIRPMGGIPKQGLSGNEEWFTDVTLLIKGRYRWRLGRIQCRRGGTSQRGHHIGGTIVHTRQDGWRLLRLVITLLLLLLLHLRIISGRHHVVVLWRLRLLRHHVVHIGRSTMIPIKARLDRRGSRNDTTAVRLRLMLLLLVRRR